jgi:hypothetical protein
MRVLIVGRHAGMMQSVLAQVAEAGFEVKGCLTDEEAIAAIQNESFQVVAIGGGVENSSRNLIKAECAKKSPPPEILEIYGPDSLLPRLQQLRAKIA